MVSGLDNTTDIVQTAAILVLAGVVVVAIWRTDMRFGQQHRDIQDAILGQYAILKQVSDQQTQIDQHAALIDKLRDDLEERCAKIDQRVIVLERPAKSA